MLGRYAQPTLLDFKIDYFVALAPRNDSRVSLRKNRKIFVAILI